MQWQHYVNFSNIVRKVSDLANRISPVWLVILRQAWNAPAVATQSNAGGMVVTDFMHNESEFIDENEAILAEFLEQALRALEEGRPIEALLEQCPQALRLTLSQMLPVTEQVVDLRLQSVPPRSKDRRAQGRAAFLAMAQQMQTAQATVASSVDVMSTATSTTLKSAAVESSSAATSSASTSKRSQPASNVVNRRPILADPSLFERIKEYLGSLGAMGGPMSMRMAPILAMLSIMLIGSVSVVQAARNSIPGDTLYPAKEWGRDVQLSLASEAEQEKLRQQQEDTRRAEIERAATEKTEYIRQTREFVVYSERGQWIWDIGGLKVKPFYIPDPSKPEVQVWMNVIGEPKPGDTVRLTYQIVPGFPNIVMGVSLEVVAVAPSTELTVSESVPPIVNIVQPTPAVVIPPLAQQCIPTHRAGWMAYRVRRDDTLSALSVASGAQVSLLMNVNCLESDVIQLGSVIFVPATSTILERVNGSPSTQPSPTPTSVPAFTPTAMATATMAPALATSETPDATVVTPVETAETVATVESSTGGNEVTPTAELSPTSEAEPTLEEGTPAETPIATSAATVASATETVDPNATPGASATAGANTTPDASATANGTTLPDTTPVGTPSLEASPTNDGTSAATPSTDATATVPSEATVPANATAAEATPMMLPSATSAPQDTSEPAATQQPTVVSSGGQATPSPVVEASPTPLPPTPVPPTLVLSTPVSKGDQSNAG